MPANMQKTKQVQHAVDEVVDIMHQNIEKVMERGEKLDTLHNKTDQLQQNSLQFKKGATKVRKAMWWKDMKMKIIIGVCVLAIVAVIIVIIVINVQPVAAAVGVGGGSQAAAPAALTQ